MEYVELPFAPESVMSAQFKMLTRVQAGITPGGFLGPKPTVARDAKERTQQDSGFESIDNFSHRLNSIHYQQDPFLIKTGIV